MDKSVTKEALKLTWAITWRWTIISTVLLWPIGYFMTSNGDNIYKTLYSFIAPAITIVSLFVVVKGLMLRGYGKSKLSVTGKD